MAKYVTASPTSGHAINAWRIDIDLTSVIPVLDIAASDLVSHQRDSLIQRKDLAQKTKDFRKLEDAGKLTEIKGLLKGMLFYYPSRCKKMLTGYSLPDLY